MKKMTMDEFKEMFVAKQNEYQTNMAIDFGKKLRELRTEKGLSQKQMAERLVVAVSTYANWEQGRTEPSIYHLIFIAVVFKVDMNTLFEFFDFSDL